MMHLGFAWIWVMSGVVIAVARLAAPTPLAGFALLLPLAVLLWLRSRWRALLRPRPGVRALCWMGHALTAAAALCFAALSTPWAGDGNALGFGLLIGLLLSPLPMIGAAAWILQLLQWARSLRRPGRGRP